MSTITGLASVHAQAEPAYLLRTLSRIAHLAHASNSTIHRPPSFSLPKIQTLLLLFTVTTTTESGAGGSIKTTTTTVATPAAHVAKPAAPAAAPAFTPGEESSTR